MTTTTTRTRAGAACLLLALLSLAAPAAAATWITGPTTITEPGVYWLANDIVDCTAPVCIDVWTGGVTIDGRGHRIDGVKAAGSAGIRDIPGTGYASGATVVRNLRVTDWDSGVRLHKVVDRTVTRCVFAANGRGVDADAVDDLAVSRCRFTGDGAGISISGASGGAIEENELVGCGDGIVLGATLPVRGVVVASNVVDGSAGTGIRLDWTSDAIAISSNLVTNCGRAGLALDFEPGHTVTNNLFSNRVNAEVTDQVACAWSVTPVKGKNIVGGRSLGGNFWGSPDGTGFSQVTADADRDGFCDAPYTVGETNVDPYPLRAKQA